MNDLDVVISKLNKYLNIKDSSDMIKMLLSPRLDDSGKVETEHQLLTMIRSLLSIQGTAQTTAQLVEAVNLYIEAEPNPSEKLAKDLKNEITDQTPREDLPPFYVTQYGANSENYGYLRKKSVCDLMRKNEPSSDTMAAGKTMSVIEIADVRLNFNNRDCSAVSTFLQVLPSIEISRAVPYFDCKIVTSLSKGSEDNSVPQEKLFANGVSIGKFLNGQITEGNESIESKYLLAKISSEQTVDRNVLNNLEKKKPSEIASSASMELFLTPQTLVQGNSTFTDLDATQEGNVDTDGNTIKVRQDQMIMDKFRPLMTWESFSLQVAPASGMISTKTADVKIKLHDRSRMNEIAPLLTPARTGDTELHIDWGWSHPESDPNKNVYGALINKMRVKEVYGVINSSYNFTPEGQVDITLKLYTKGARNVAFDLIKGRQDGSGSNQNIMDVMNQAVTTLRETMAELRGQGYNLKEDLGAPDILNKATSTKGLLSLTSDEIEELESFIKSLKKIKTKDSGAVFSDFADKFDRALGSTSDFAEAQTKHIQNAINAMMGGEDQYLATPTIKSAGKELAINTNTHVSFAKFLLHMVGDTLLATGKFDDIQFIFYPMNEYAMWAKDYNIGQYPMSKTVLEGIFKDEFAKKPTMRIQTLLNLVRKYFMNNVGDDIYGFGEFYDDKNKLEVKKDFKEKKSKKQEMAVKKQEIMQACYGEGTKRFKKPNVQMFVESVVSADGKNILRLHFTDKNCTSFSSYADLWSATNKSNIGTISKRRRTLVKSNKSEPPKGQSEKKKKESQRDAASRPDQTTTHDLAYNQALEYFKESGVLREMGGKFVINGGPDRLRGLMASNMPTLKYGTEFSGILAANLSTQSNQQMEAIHMVRQKNNSSPALPGENGMPMKVRPAQLTLDTFGCPLINFGQQFFIDFNTNSSLDDIYAVTGLSHTISPSEFKTNVKMVPLQKMGQFGSLVDTLSDITALAKDAGQG